MWRGTGAGRQDSAGRIVQRQFAGAFVEAVDEYAVAAEIRNEEKAIVGRENHHVRVRLFLPRIDAGQRVLKETGGLAQRAVGLNGKRRDASAGIVGGEQPVSGAIDCDVARTGAARGNDVDQLKFAAIHREGADGAGRVGGAGRMFIRRVQVAAAGVHRQEGRALRFRGERGRRELAGGFVKLQAVDAFALRVGVRADEHGYVRCGRCGREEQSSIKEPHHLADREIDGCKIPLSHDTARYASDGLG